MNGLSDLRAAAAVARKVFLGGARKANGEAHNEDLFETSRHNGLRNYGKDNFCGQDIDVIEAALNAYNTKYCKPPTDAKEIRDLAKWLSSRDSTDAEQNLGEFAGADPRIVDDLRTAPADLIILPCDSIPFTLAARRIFRQLARSESMFARGGRVVELVTNADGYQTLDIVDAAAFRSRIERPRFRTKTAIVSGNQLVLKFKRCSADTAETLLKSVEARDLLPPIALVTRSAVLAEFDGALNVLGPGYHNIAGGVMVFGDQEPPDVPLDIATRDLLAILDGFQFATKADKSRAIANIIAPCLRMNRLLFGHACILVVQANDSQAGKGLYCGIVRAIYNERGHLIAKRTGGVGSFDESLSEGLISGEPFIVIDNVRGKISSQLLEAVLTALGSVEARVPHKGAMKIDPSRVVMQITSNGFEATVDLGNRAMIMSIVKQAPDYEFRTYDEGSVLQHVTARHLHYLGCVFAVVKHWYAAGKPRLRTTHSFTEWVGTLD